MSTTNLPPDNSQNLQEHNYFAWFNKYHLKNLEKSYEAIDEEYDKHPLGEGFSQDTIKELLLLLDNFILFSSYFPNGSTENEIMIKIIGSRKKFESDYLNKEANEMSYWDVQQLKSDSFEILNYMNAMCEDE